MIPVNLVTGFLGVGKTTLIRHLLREHPQDQRWAVLVNEFGEIGVDGSLLDDEGVAIEEVAGGCLCCVAAPAFTVGLNRLIREQRPDRILIEPSGLGHPAQVLDNLRSPMYSKVLQIQATLCVMDARHLDSPRHRDHPNFLDQIHLADVLIGNKADQYTEANELAFMQFAAGLQPPKSRLLMTERGQIDPTHLLLAGELRQATFPEAHAFLLQQQPQDSAAPEGDWVYAEGQSDGYWRLGWLIDQRHGFARDPLCQWLDNLPAERVKGLLQGEDGWFTYNRSNDAAEIGPAKPGAASRLQIIHADALDPEQLDQQLRKLVAGN